MYKFKDIWSFFVCFFHSWVSKFKHLRHEHEHVGNEHNHAARVGEQLGHGFSADHGYYKQILDLFSSC